MSSIDVRNISESIFTLPPNRVVVRQERVKYEPSSLVEQYGGLVGRQHVKKDGLHLVPFGRCEVVDERIQQQRADSVLAVLPVDTERQDVTDVRVATHRLGQDAAVLFVEFSVRFNLGDDQSDNGQVVDRGQRKEPRTGRDVLVPGQRIVDREPVLTERPNLLQVIGAEEAQLDIVDRAQRNRFGLQLVLRFGRPQVVVVVQPHTDDSLEHPPHNTHTIHKFQFNQNLGTLLAIH